ncbi:apq12p [Saccharomyces arboricola H-6]|uniref:Apq12p n=1 Tax=Saccharomyces arboricola (strain H-6 / AS 2.3317 / CBS 10644) TaxID=1160507 RepID=J8LMI0_SACAR|nr:apq12p [Saccharomyces arboricola H-6]
MDAIQPQYELSVVTQCLKFAIDIIQWLIPAITKFSQSHPLIFQLSFILLTLYVFYKLLLNLITLVKRTLYIAMIVSCIGIYIRGSQQFLTVDLLNFYNFVMSNRYYAFKIYTLFINALEKEINTVYHLAQMKVQQLLK